MRATRQREDSAPKAPRAPAPKVNPTHAQALALQRSVGNRATARMLARWTKHPDQDKKGVMVPDAVAAELLRFSPPTNE